MRKLKRLSREVIVAGFPELLDREVRVVWREINESEDANLTCEIIKGGKLEIKVDKGLMQMPENALKGGLAHEFAHAIKDIKKPKLLYEIEGRIYENLKRYKGLVEKETDLLTIKRGFGRNLLEFAKYCEDFLGGYDPLNYTPQELEALVSQHNQ